jgi:hypothetical protein
VQRWRYSGPIIAVAGLVFALLGATASAAGPDCPQAQAGATGRLQRLLENVPCPASGRVADDASDDHGDSMSVLDPIADPAGGYLGVYHTAFRPPGDPFENFRISLARSSDLIHWTRLEVIDGSGASMPTLRAIAGAPGFLLAYEKSTPGGNVVRIRYYPSRDALLAGRFSAQRDLPREFSPYNNGTPTILWAHWNGALSHSVIQVGFHYESAPKGRRGPDREAIGTLRGFRTWSARPDPATDSDLDNQGLRGSHGDWRQFLFGGSRWRVYEAQTSFNDFGTWRVVLDDPGSRRVYSLALRLGSQTVAHSFANPIARVEPAPGGQGLALVVTMYLFAGPVRGELVYFQPM